MKASNLNLAQIAEAVNHKRAADDAKKTAEERLAEVSTKAEASSAENELLKSFIAKDAATRFASLSDEAKGFVTEFAGDDPIAQYKFMTSENFQKMTAKAPARTQGGVRNAPDAASEGGSKKEDELFEKMMASKDPNEKRELSLEIQAMQKKDGLASALSAMGVK